MKNRSERRHHEERVKAKTLRKLKAWDKARELTPDVIGRNAAMHCTHICRMGPDGRGCWRHEVPTRLLARDERRLMESMT